jgi:HK97 gp10 family phage protein
MDAKIEFDGSEVFNNINNFLDALTNKLAEKTEQATLFIEGEAKKNCPVDDGLLRASIGHYVEVDGMKATGYVGSNSQYSVFVHQGTGIYALEGNGRKEVPWHYKNLEGNWHTTSGQKPQPFLQDAIDANMGKLTDFFKGLLE